jgi:integrase
VLVLGTQTGLRITALTSIGWDAIEWPAEGQPGHGLLRVPPELDKVGRGYAVPLSRRAHELLARAFAERGDDGGPILRGKSIRRTVGTTTLSSIRLACARAGLPDPDSPNHHMRRSFGRWAVFGQLTGRPVPLYVVSRWMGHSSVAMTQRYLQLDDDTSAEWMSEEG